MHLTEGTWWKITKLNVEIHRIVFRCQILVYFMSAEMIIAGVILFSGMTAAAVKIYLNRMKERIEQETLDENHA